MVHIDHAVRGRWIFSQMDDRVRLKRSKEIPDKVVIRNISPDEFQIELIHVIEHDIVAALDIIFEHAKTGKWSDVLNI